jgi:transcriptional regulator with XRE-family HTH domain
MEKGENLTVFGKTLQNLRKEQGLSQAKLANASGVSRRAILHYEKYAKRPSIDKVKKLANVLGVSDEELLGIKSMKRNKSLQISNRVIKKARVIDQLPLTDQKTIFRIINTMAEKNNIHD